MVFFCYHTNVICYAYSTIRYGSTLTAALYQCDVPYFTVVLRKVFGVAGAAFVDNRVPNMRVSWPSGDWGSLPLEGGIYVSCATLRRFYINKDVHPCISN